MDRLRDGWTMEQILASYPRLTREDLLAAIRLVTEVFREEAFVAAGGADGLAGSMRSAKSGAHAERGSQKKGSSFQVPDRFG